MADLDAYTRRASRQHYAASLPLALLALAGAYVVSQFTGPDRWWQILLVPAVFFALFMPMTWWACELIYNRQYRRFRRAQKENSAEDFTFPVT